MSYIAISACHRFVLSKGLCNWPSLYDKVRATILCPAGLILLPAERKLFTVANGRQRTRRDPQIDEITLCAFCSFSSQCEVILAGSTLVTMPFDLDLALRIRFEPCSVT